MTTIPQTETQSAIEASAVLAPVYAGDLVHPEFERGWNTCRELALVLNGTPAAPTVVQLPARSSILGHHVEFVRGWAAYREAVLLRAGAAATCAALAAPSMSIPACLVPSFLDEHGQLAPQLVAWLSTAYHGLLAGHASEGWHGITTLSKDEQARRQKAPIEIIHAWLKQHRPDAWGRAYCAFRGIDLRCSDAAGNGTWTWCQYQWRDLPKASTQAFTQPDAAAQDAQQQLGLPD